MITTEELIRDFSEENFAGWCRGKFVDFVPKSERLDEGDFGRARQIGYVRTLAEDGVNRPLLVATVQVQGELGERSSRKRQFDFARKALQRAIDRPPGTAGGLFTQGLFVFYGENGDFRMSLISGRVEGGKLAYNSFKRQTFFVRQDQVNRTFRDQMEKGLGDYKTLCEAFSIEALTKQFYNELFKWYEWALTKEMGVTFPNDIHDDKDDSDLNAEHMIRLITRLMFVWFIKLKQLVPGKIFDADKVKALLKSFDSQSKTQDNYYRVILQNLFFATLNNKIEDRDFARDGGSVTANKEQYGVKTLYRYEDEFAIPEKQVLELFRGVPFLNGGLFECLDKETPDRKGKVLYFDGFSRNTKKRAHVPNLLFFHKDKSGDPDKDKGLIPLFKRYNFTVEENSPNDAEVALDPELLGKVFENLLGAYNPETKETARKQSGSFYTPREIVNFMVDESLKQYLKARVSGAEDATLDQLFESQSEKSTLPAKMRNDLAEAIRKVKILDPACGSGAFPMGALQRMVSLLSKLEDKTENIYDLKLHLIEKCIYGVDIQTIAVQISKLRFFISLVCEQEPDLKKWRENYCIPPLPNLETKFVAANTLVGLENNDLGLGDAEIDRLRNDLLNVRHRHFLAKTSQEKRKCRIQDEELRGKIKERIVAIASTPDKEKIAHLEKSIRKLEAEKEIYRGEKWEYITVPKQGDLFGGEPENAVEKRRVDTNQAKRDEIEGNIQRNEREIAAENSKRLTGELENAADKLAAWNPYDQNKPATFFDPLWMFGVGDGFDIVTGNPPYVQIQKLPEEHKEDYSRQKYKTFSKAGDLYCIFYERSLLLLKNGGILSFISSNKFFRAGYGRVLREHLNDRHEIRIIVDFCELPVFEAGTDPCILVIANQKASNSDIRVAVVKDIESIQDVRTTLLTIGFSLARNKLSEEGWGFENAHAIPLLEKFHKAGIALGEYVKKRFYRGILTGLNSAFVVDKETRDTMVAADRKCAKVIKPWLRGIDIKRWHRDLQDLYLINILSSSNFDWPWSNSKSNDKAEKIFRDTYPSIYAHMKPYRDELIARGDKGKYYWELRACAYHAEFDKTKIVFNETSKELHAFLDTEKLQINKTGFIIVCDKPKFLLGILNSQLLDFIYRSEFPSWGDPWNGGRIQFRAERMELIPIPPVSAAQEKAIEGLVSKVIEAKAADADADTKKLEAEINHLVYGLYKFSDDEISIVESATAPASPKNTKTKPTMPSKQKPISMLDDDEGLD